ncbi:hypothetical protein Tco_1060065 [Tanacetum coccineum]
MSSLFPYLQQLTPIPTPTTEATTSTTAASDFETLSAFHQRVTDLEKDVKDLKTVDHSAILLSTIKSKVPNAVKEYLGTSLDDALHNVLQKHSTDITKEHYKTSKDTEPSKKAKSTKTSKGTSKSQPKSTVKSAQEEETVFEAGDTQEPHNQGQDMGNTDDQPNVKAAPKHDWFKKPERPPTPNSDWNVRKSIDFRLPQTWISKIAQAEKPPLSFDELMSTPIDFSAYFKIDKLAQEHLVGPTFNLLKGTCKSLVELEYNFEECYKALTDRTDNQEKDEKQSQNDKTGLGMEKL